ncbi:MAG: SDR family NAD(P)-dependent oxidoreductase, partial [Candidatus Delongbacteria bacterium]|nr:SDR family NAD(P)-dependent oxidoreductase [Candidatus Delongbacteria bacterium]
MNYYIITGTSKGLGEALANRLLNENNCLFCISRTKNSKLISLSEKHNTNLIYFGFDLNKANKIEHLLDDIFEKIDINKVESMNLINNAGTIKPIKTIEKLTSEEIINSFNVNLIAPTIIASKFIERTLNYSCEKRIINISSGAA